LKIISLKNAENKPVRRVFKTYHRIRPFTDNKWVFIYRYATIWFRYNTAKAMSPYPKTIKYLRSISTFHRLKGSKIDRNKKIKEPINPEIINLDFLEIGY